MMNDKLNAIASLEFGKAVELLAKERQERVRAALSASARRGGFGGHTVTDIELEYAEKICRKSADIWVELLEGTNGGKLTRQNVDFIKTRVAEIAASRKSSLINAPRTGPRRTVTDNGHIAREMEKIASNVGRELELRFRRQEVGLPKGDGMKDGINVTIGNAANVNLGSQTGAINAALNVMSQQGLDQSEVVDAIKELSEAVIRSSAIRDDQKQEALEVIAGIAKQAEIKPEHRSKGTIRALISGLPAVIGLTADLTALWDKYAPVLRAYFGI